MKKLLLLIFLAFFPVFLFSNGFGVSFGTLGYGVNSNEGVPGGYLHGRIFDFSYQGKTGLGLSVSPCVFSYGLLNDDFSYTFINASLFYNFFSRSRNNLLLGPFLSINAVNIENPQYLAFRSGLNFSFRSSYELGDNSYYFFSILNIELGYNKIINSKQGFYAEASIDLLSVFGLFYLLGMSAYDSETEKYYEENPVYPPVLPRSPD